MADKNFRNKIETLIKKMTLEEKVAQLCCVPAHQLIDSGRFSEKKAKELLSNGIGLSRIAHTGLAAEQAAEMANSIQKFLHENTRLKIPAIIHEEALAGFCAKRATAYPQPIGLASTFEPELVRRMAINIKKEMRSVGAHHALSPVLDVFRDPRWGRAEETYGEDHYLVSLMAVAYVKGLQGNDLKNGIIATAKHFAGHSFSEGGRNHAPVHIGVRELKEVFLYPFEKVVKEADIQCIMNAYHEIDGIPCASSRELLTGILREDWGFEGFIVSDYSSIDLLMTQHHTAADKKEAAKQALEAGLDVECFTISCYGKPLIDAVREGLVSEETVNTAAGRVLRAKYLLGLFEKVYVKPEDSVKILDCREHRALSLEIAKKSIVLLKNDADLLPLAKNIKSIAVIGPNAASEECLLGCYSYKANHKATIPVTTVLQGIKNKVSDTTTVRYAKGCDFREISKDGFPEAVEAAKKSDIVVLVLGGRSGLPDATSGEWADKAHTNLTGVQEELAKAVYNTGTPVVLVLVNGRPLSIEWMSENIRAIIEAWIPGEEGGTALADILFGDYNPAGRLPVSIPRTVGQVPVNYNRKPTSFNPYVLTKVTPLFPFGHGLSYTRFEYSNISISPQQVRKNGELEIKFTVKNTGKYDGDEVVQLYVHDIVASIPRPVKELKRFQRVNIKKGGKKQIVFKLPVKELAFYNKDFALEVESGTFDLMIGASSEDIRIKTTFDVL
ncbi:MAG: glycoside hydrolase family 3 N-terminal domain-containing protein [Planctomycetota bacterium]